MPLSRCLTALPERATKGYKNLRCVNFGVSCDWQGQFPTLVQCVAAANAKTNQLVERASRRLSTGTTSEGPDVSAKNRIYVGSEHARSFQEEISEYLLLDCGATTSLGGTVTWEKAQVKMIKAGAQSLREHHGGSEQY